jgi:hypothetical protein
VPHGLYNLWAASGSLNTPNRALSAGVSFGVGARPIFAEASRGRQLDASAGVTWRPTDAVRVEARWVHSRLDRSADGSRFSVADIPRVKLEYQLTRDIFFRYVGQYLAQEQAALRSPRDGRPLIVDGTLAGPQTVNDFRSDVLFSYRPTPGTVFFLGYGASLTENDAFAFQDLRRTEDGFFLKASYLFRL